MMVGGYWVLYCSLYGITKQLEENDDNTLHVAK